MDLKKFKFKYQLRVRSYEVDWAGIVHNAVYLQYFETGRIEYLKHLGIEVSYQNINTKSRVVIVRNEINYKHPARFDDLLDIYVRISTIGKTSFTFESVIVNPILRKYISDNISVHVWLDEITGEPIKVDDRFIETVQNYEGDNLKFI
ncbi:MAG: 4-hydroxybenzoyl-CoA thioesterase family active site [Ignavibacteriae bacterium]|nr:MAG: 4-hydroxybenzoyl-CoA thioesterase family active site [Ignavibacteriota bacterium]